MEKFLKVFASKTLIGLSVLCLASILASGIGTHFIAQKEKQIVEVKYGMNVCFARLTQSMLAIMHIDLNSKSLSRDFFEQSNECFVQFKNDLKSQGVREESAAFQSIKELIANVLDFHRQLGIITARPKDSLQIAGVQSELSPHYTKVDRDRFAFNQLVSKELAGTITGSGNTWMLGFLYAVGAVSALLLTLGLSFLAWQKQRRLQQREIWENAADDLLVTALENSLRIENFFVEVWKTDGLTNTLKLFKSYHEKLLERTFALSNLRTASGRKTMDMALDVSELQPGKLSLSAQMPLERIAPLNAIEVLGSNPEKEDAATHWEQSVNHIESHAMQDTMSDINYYNAKVEKTLSDWDFEVARELDSTNTHKGALHSDEGINIDTNREIESEIEEKTLVQGVNFWETIKKVESRLSSELDDKLSISVKKYESGINVISASEILEQLTYSIFQKFHKMFAQFGTPFTQRDVNLSLKFDPLENKANITFLAQSTLFSLDDLEYFSTDEGESDPVQIPLQVDKTSTMIRELLRSLQGAIRIQNILSDDSEPQKCQITLVIPAIQLGADEREDTLSSSGTGRFDRMKAGGTLTQVIKGKKKDILQNIVKEITI
ncbi:MAG: hypothetical protein QE271_05260 [Bacteriovoracaceae bacterium]|nr:hypothetical protein [Bacteriovoracaceae bacterium]